jgi:hypothetical protein
MGGLRRRGGEGEVFLSRGEKREEETGGVRVPRADARQRRPTPAGLFRPPPPPLARRAKWRCCPPPARGPPVGCRGRLERSRRLAGVDSVNSETARESNR